MMLTDIRQVDQEQADKINLRLSSFSKNKTQVEFWLKISADKDEFDYVFNNIVYYCSPVTNYKLMERIIKCMCKELSFNQQYEILHEIEKNIVERK